MRSRVTEDHPSRPPHDDLATADPAHAEPGVYPGDRRGERLTLGDKAKGVALWAAGVGWLVPMLGTLTALQRFVPSDRHEPLNRLYTRGQVALTGSRWRANASPEQSSTILRGRW